MIRLISNVVALGFQLVGVGLAGFGLFKISLPLVPIIAAFRGFMETEVWDLSEMRWVHFIHEAIVGGFFFVVGIGVIAIIGWLWDCVDTYLDSQPSGDQQMSER